MLQLERCGWALSHPLMMEYHDQEWGVPTRDRIRLFEFLILEGVQAGLSWMTVLGRRERYREALNNFDPALVAEYGQKEIDELLSFPGLIHHSKKIFSHVTNARRFLMVEQEWGDFAQYLWSFVGNRPEIHHYASNQDLPSTSALSIALSQDLKRRGFQYVGPTICYSYLQATGLVMDHITTCYRYRELARPTEN